MHHNHIRCATTKTPRIEGLFAFHSDCDFKTIRITDNIVECEDTPRPLLRSKESTAATIENNRLVNVSDIASYDNTLGDTPIGPGKTLRFQCGVNGESTVDGWEHHLAPKAKPSP